MAQLPTTYRWATIAHGESPDSGAHATVTTYDAISAVSTANSSLNANLTTLRTNWTAALE